MFPLKNTAEKEFPITITKVVETHKLSETRMFCAPSGSDVTASLGVGLSAGGVAV